MPSKLSDAHLNILVEYLRQAHPNEGYFVHIRSRPPRLQQINTDVRRLRNVAMRGGRLFSPMSPNNVVKARVTMAGEVSESVGEIVDLFLHEHRVQGSTVQRVFALMCWYQSTNVGWWQRPSRLWADL